MDPPKRSAPLAPFPSAYIVNPDFTTVTCLIAELAGRSLLARLIFMKRGDIRLHGWSGLRRKNTPSSGRWVRRLVTMMMMVVVA